MESVRFVYRLCCLTTCAINPLYTGGLFHCYILDESVSHFRSVGSVLSLLAKFLMEHPVSSKVDPDQTQHYVASDLGLYCFPMTLHEFPRKNWLIHVTVPVQGRGWDMVLCNSSWPCHFLLLYYVGVERVLIFFWKFYLYRNNYILSNFLSFS